MSSTDPVRPPVPRLPLALLRVLLPPAERQEVLADVTAEHAARVAAEGPDDARRWLWRQAVGSAPSLLRWGWWRGWTGFEPRANRLSPGGAMPRHWIDDLRYAARRLRARPGYTALAVLTLALGVGGTSAVYGIARGLLFEPLPYANEREVTTFWMQRSWTEEEFLHLRGRIPGYRQVAAYRPADATLRQGDAPARLVPGVSTSIELFDVLGARPVLGPGFRTGDDAMGAEPVAVISHGLWQELGGDAAIIGKRLTFDGTPRTIVGVMPREFWFPDPSVRLWRAEELNPQSRSGNYTFVGRVAQGRDPRAMEAPVAELTRMLDERFDYPEKWDKTKDATVTPIRDELTGSMRPALLATLGAMALILLIACANVAALMLGQLDARSSELAVRSALGAGRSRLTRQLAIEATLVALMAGALGAGLAAGGYGLLARALPLGAWAAAASPDWTVFVSAMAIALLAALLVVVVPTISLWRGDLRGVLGRARTGGLEGRGGRLENGLVVAEVALAVLIASGAALLVRSVQNLYALDAGLKTDDVAVVDVVGSADMTSERHRQDIRVLLDALAALPGVSAVATTQRLPLRGGGDNWSIAVEGLEEASRGTTTFVRVVSADYFDVMGMRLRTGRLYDPSDRRIAPPAQGDTMPAERTVVINEALAKKYFPGENPIGRRLGGAFPGWERIIGVVADAAEGKLTDDREPARYFLEDQVPIYSDSKAIVLRMKPGTDPASVLDAARRTVARTAPDFAVPGTTTMERVLDTAVGPARQVMSLLSLLTALALVLGAVGIYGVIAHFASRRQRDWAIRLALGLPGSKVVRHIVAHGAGLVVVGIGIGVGTAALLARLLASLLYGVSALDPLALAAGGGALLVVGLLAAFVPARRAGTTDPALVLREQ